MYDIKNISYINNMEILWRGMDDMKQFTIDFDEVAYKWLEHIADVTGKSIEKVIIDGIYNQIVELEKKTSELFEER